jgi:hypothetical protein
MRRLRLPAAGVAVVARAGATGANRAAMADVQSLDYFIEYARTQRDYALTETQCAEVRKR